MRAWGLAKCIGRPQGDLLRDHGRQLGVLPLACEHRQLHRLERRGELELLRARRSRRQQLPRSRRRGRASEPGPPDLNRQPLRAFGEDLGEHAERRIEVVRRRGRDGRARDRDPELRVIRGEHRRLRERRGGLDAARGGHCQEVTDAVLDIADQLRELQPLLPDARGVLLQPSDPLESEAGVQLLRSACEHHREPLLPRANVSAHAGDERSFDEPCRGRVARQLALDESGEVIPLAIANQESPYRPCTDGVGRVELDRAAKHRHRAHAITQASKKLSDLESQRRGNRGVLGRLEVCGEPARLGVKVSRCGE